LLKHAGMLSSTKAMSLLVGGLLDYVIC